MSDLSAKVRRLERGRGIGAGGSRICPVCRDGAAPGPVYLVEEGKEPERPVPRCPGCGREHATPVIFGFHKPGDPPPPERPAPPLINPGGEPG